MVAVRTQCSFRKRILQFDEQLIVCSCIRNDHCLGIRVIYDTVHPVQLVGNRISSRLTEHFIVCTEMGDPTDFSRRRFMPEIKEGCTFFIIEHFLSDLVLFKTEILDSAYMSIIVMVLPPVPVAIFIEVICEVEGAVIPECNVLFIYAVVIKSVSIVVLSLGYGIFPGISGKIYFHFTGIDFIPLTVQSQILVHVSYLHFFADLAHLLEFLADDRKPRLISECQYLGIIACVSKGTRLSQGCMGETTFVDIYGVK